MNEWTHFFIKKYISHTLFSKGLILLWSVRNGWRDIYSKGGLLLPISSSWSQGVPTLAAPCKLVRDPLIGLMSNARIRFSALCLNLTAWFSSRGLLPVTLLLNPSALIAMLFTYQNETACQSTRGHQERTENPCHMLYNIYCWITIIETV